MYIVMDMACYLFKERKRLSWGECLTVEPHAYISLYAPFEIVKLPSFWHEKSPTFTFIIFLSNLTPMLQKEKPFDVFKRPPPLLFKKFTICWGNKKKKAFSITKLCLQIKLIEIIFSFRNVGCFFCVFNLSWWAPSSMLV